MTLPLAVHGAIAVRGPGVRHASWLLVFLSAAAITFVGCSSHKKAEAEAAPSVPHPGDGNPQIETTTVEEHDVSRVIACSARIAFDESRVAHIWSPVTGRVTKITANLGDKVRAGQQLALIRSPDLGNALSDVEKAKPTVAQLEKNLRRQQELYAVHAGAQRDLESIQAAYDQAVAELQRAEARAKLLTASAGTIDSALQSFSLTSPIAGEIVARQINPGAEVQGQYNGGTGGELFTVGSTDSVWAFAEIYEQDLGVVKLGAPVELRLVAFPEKTFEGKVDWVSGMVDPVSRTTKVRCILPNPDHLLKPEMYATANIVIGARRALAIPRSALLHLRNATEVIAVDKARNRYEHRPVVVEENESGSWLPVLTGLERGDSVVSRGALLLSVDD
jgi:cobalt-zinc-cadmium efflux system membrane fusion protein